MNTDVIGRNALTPVLNREDAMKEWERRQSGKAAAPSQPYPQLEYLQQQAELAAASGLSSWAGTAAGASRYPAQPSKLSHSYNPQSMVTDDVNEGSRRDAVMSNVRSAARGDGGAAMYGSAGGVISNPPQAYTGNSTTSGNRYAMTYNQQQQAPSSNVFDSVDRRTDIGNMFVPMQPDSYQPYSSSPGTASARIAPPSQAVPPSFYGAGVVSPGQVPNQLPPPSSQHRNPFSVNDSSSQQKDGRRGSGMDSWPR